MTPRAAAAYPAAAAAADGNDDAATAASGPPLPEEDTLRRSSSAAGTAGRGEESGGVGEEHCFRGSVDADVGEVHRGGPPSPSLEKNGVAPRVVDSASAGATDDNAEGDEDICAPRSTRPGLQESGDASLNSRMPETQKPPSSLSAADAGTDEGGVFERGNGGNGRSGADGENPDDGAADAVRGGANGAVTGASTSETTLSACVDEDDEPAPPAAPWIGRGGSDDGNDISPPVVVMPRQPVAERLPDGDGMATHPGGVVEETRRPPGRSAAQDQEVDGGGALSPCSDIEVAADSGLPDVGELEGSITPAAANGSFARETSVVDPTEVSRRAVETAALSEGAAATGGPLATALVQEKEEAQEGEGDGQPSVVGQSCRDGDTVALTHLFLRDRQDSSCRQPEVRRRYDYDELGDGKKNCRTSTFPVSGDNGVHVANDVIERGALARAHDNYPEGEEGAGVSLQAVALPRNSRRCIFPGDDDSQMKQEVIAVETLSSHAEAWLSGGSAAAAAIDNDYSAAGNGTAAHDDAGLAAPRPLQAQADGEHLGDGDGVYPGNYRSGIEDRSCGDGGAGTLSVPPGERTPIFDSHAENPGAAWASKRGSGRRAAAETEGAAGLRSIVASASGSSLGSSSDLRVLGDKASRRAKIWFGVWLGGPPVGDYFVVHARNIVKVCVGIFFVF